MIVPVGVAVGGVPVTVGVGVRVMVGVGVAVGGVPVTVGVLVTVEVIVGVRVAVVVSVTVGVTVSVGVGVMVGVEVSVGVRVSVGVSVTVGVRVIVGVTVLVVVICAKTERDQPPGSEPIEFELLAAMAPNPEECKLAISGVSLMGAFKMAESFISSKKVARIPIKTGIICRAWIL